jgi:hypothetical protein
MDDKSGSYPFQEYPKGYSQSNSKALIGASVQYNVEGGNAVNLKVK